MEPELSQSSTEDVHLLSKNVQHLTILDTLVYRQKCHIIKTSLPSIPSSQSTVIGGEGQRFLPSGPLLQWFYRGK